MQKDSSKSLWQYYPAHFYVPLFLMINMVLLGISYWLPFMVIKKLVFFQDDYSILHSLASMWDAQYYFLSLLIFAFSVVFPFAKLLVLLAVWFFPATCQGRIKLLKTLGVLGKWSMLDVFIAAVIIFLTVARPIISVNPKPGLYLFALAIVMSMILTVAISSMAERLDNQSAPSSPVTENA